MAVLSAAIMRSTGTSNYPSRRRTQTATDRLGRHIRKPKRLSLLFAINSIARSLSLRASASHFFILCISTLLRLALFALSLFTHFGKYPGRRFAHINNTRKYVYSFPFYFYLYIHLLGKRRRKSGRERKWKEKNEKRNFGQVLRHTNSLFCRTFK